MPKWQIFLGSCCRFRNSACSERVLSMYSRLRWLKDDDAGQHWLWNTCFSRKFNMSHRVSVPVIYHWLYTHVACRWRSWFCCIFPCFLILFFWRINVFICIWNVWRFSAVHEFYLPTEATLQYLADNIRKWNGVEPHVCRVKH